jgi:hypothetical protein
MVLLPLSKNKQGATHGTKYLALAHNKKSQEITAFTGILSHVKKINQKINGSPSWTRTNNHPVNSRVLYH